MSDLAVADSSVLIALGQLGHIDLLRSLFEEIIAPEAVWTETGRHNLPEWIGRAKCSGRVLIEGDLSSLGQGEKEAITLATEVSADWLLIDERAARRLAAQFRIQIIGTLGLLLAAKRHGLVPAVRPLIESLSDLGFRVSPDLHETILAAAGEA